MSVFKLSACSQASLQNVTPLHCGMQEIAPNEASVWFQMGKIYKKLEQHDEALRHFNTALDLKPSSSDSNLIKSAIEKIKISDETDDEEI